MDDILGQKVEKIELEFSEKFMEDCFTVGVDNGLNAIHLGLLTAGIKPEDEINVQANGYIATMLGIIQCGAKPVFVELNEFFNMDSNRIEDAVTSKTRAVLVTHLYGFATEMDEIVDICMRKNLLLFEDCAQAHFSLYNNKYTG